MAAGIYKIVSPSGKIYIGQSMDLGRRENEYGRLQCEGQPKIYYSINKHGWDKHKWFKFEYPVEVLNEMEVKFKLEVIDALGWDGALFCEIYDTGGGPKSESTRNKISVSNIGKHNMTPEQKERRVATWKQTLLNKGGHSWGDKISVSQTGIDKPGKWKQVHQYNKDGTFIKTWSSVKEAELYYGKDPDKDNISACARGKQKTAYGFVWKY
jgi:group I intron endonuclease